MNIEYKINKDKYENAILYFIKYCNSSYLGKVKLNKLLYYLDFISFRDQGCSITGDEYINKEFGPVPKSIDEILSLLIKEGTLEIKQPAYKDGHTNSYKHLQEPDIEIFNAYEKDLLERICKEFLNWNTDKIVAQTHLEAPWFYSKPYNEVDYKYASDIEFFEDILNGKRIQLAG